MKQFTHNTRTHAKTHKKSTHGKNRIMATTVVVLSEDGKTKTTLKSLPPMKPLRDALIEYASKCGIENPSNLEFRLEKIDSKTRKVAHARVDMECPLRHLNLPANAKLKVFAKSVVGDAKVGGVGGVFQREQQQQQQQQPLTGNRGALASGNASTAAASKSADRNDTNTSSSSTSTVLGKRSARVVRQKTLDAEAEDRNARATMDPTNGLVSANEELPEAFFELSSAEAAQIVAANRRKLENGNVLLTKKHREQEAQRRREKVQNATIRIMFQQKPISDVCVEAVFDAHKETVADVYTFVREIIADDSMKFELFVAPPKRVLKRNGQDANQSLYDAGLAPAAKIFFSSPTPASHAEEEEEVILLNARCLEMLRLHDQSSTAMKPVRPPPPPRKKEEDPSAASSSKPATTTAGMTEQAKKSFVPKWFKK